MADYLSEAVTVRVATEAVRGVHPTTGWWTAQVDVGGISGFQRSYTDVERDIHSVNATMEKGDHVAYEVTASITHDMNKEFADGTLQSVYRCNAKHFGGTGLSLFRPTAVVDGGAAEDSFTVAASGNLSAGRLIRTRGFGVAANNGTFVTVASADPLAIKVATGTLTAEAAPPANATLDVVGVQGAAGDLELSAAGHLTSTALDFTTLGLVVGMWIYLPSAAEATAMGDALYAFSNSAYTGYARITAIAATQLSLERHTWTLGAATTETTSKVRVFCMSRFHRNWALDDATNYDAETLSLEKEDIKPGTAADTRYTYVHGCGPNQLSISSPLNSKITATLSLIGMTATTPLAAESRKAGPSTAYAPHENATALVDAQNDIDAVRIGDSGGAMLTEFNEWTYTHGNNITPKGVQGVFGAADLNYGKYSDQVSFQGYHSDSDVIAAVDENRSGLWYDVLVRNHQFGWLLDMPNAAIRNQSLTYAGNQPVMISGDIVAFRSPTDGIQASLGVFGWLPTA